jgi:secreted PhoX family phosphatase
MIIDHNTSTEAVIYLKDGKRKYGVLIDNELEYAYQFISNDKINTFYKTNNMDCIELLSTSLIEAIDINLK